MFVRFFIAMESPALNIENLRVNFGGRVALYDVNLRVEEGSFTAIVGPNGSGKTTLLKTILGLIKPNAGKIEIFGASLKDYSPDLIGYVPQIKSQDRKFPAKAIELALNGAKKNWIGLISKSEREKAMEALSKVGAENLAERDVNTLSGGELQRIYLARSFARNPRLLLLDEPATGVDMVCEKTLNNSIEDYCKKEGKTVVMVSHNWAAAYHHAEKVALLNKTPIAIGPPEEALAESVLAKAFTHIGKDK